MYIVKRTSLSGGTEYMVPAVYSRYRYEKKTKNMAHRFASRSHANMLAKNSAAHIEKVADRKSRSKSRR